MSMRSSSQHALPTKSVSLEATKEPSAATATRRVGRPHRGLSLARDLAASQGKHSRALIQADFPPSGQYVRPHKEIFPQNLVLKERLRDRSLVAIRSHSPAVKPCAHNMFEYFTALTCKLRWRPTCARVYRSGSLTSFEKTRPVYSGFSRDSGAWDGPTSAGGPRWIPSGRDVLGERFLAGDAAGPNGPKGPRAPSGPR
jgi:hypothetical protein